MTDLHSPTLQVANLVKRYGAKTVLNSLSFNVAAGEVLAILGPNGAGKTTLIATILGLTAATAGEVSLLGQLQQGTKRSAQLRQQLGVMMQVGGANANLKVHEQCDLFSSYYANGRSVADLLNVSGLTAQANSHFGRLSGGQKQRLLFALALAGKPKLLFLDEPTLGMDVQARRALWQQITELKASGVSIVLTTHYLQEAEQLADKVLVLQQGNIIASGSPAQLTAQISSKQIRCRTALSDQQLMALPAVLQLERQDKRVSLRTEAAEQTVQALLQADPRVSELEITAVALEQAFIQLTNSEEPA